MASTSVVFTGSRVLAPTRGVASSRSRPMLMVTRAQKDPIRPIDSRTDTNSKATSGPTATPDKAGTNKEYPVDEAMTFDGPAPETINGRLAMIGFVAAVGAEIFTGKSILQQFGEQGGIITAIAGLFIVASLVPVFRGANLKGKGPGPMTKKAEIWNGRFAMLGVAALIVIESIKGSSLF